MNILIADDDELARFTLDAMLSKLGYGVTACATGKQALDHLLKEDGPRMALLDWNMPSLTGPEVCERVRALRGPSSHYLMLLTVRNGAEDILAGLRSGANDYLTKPMNLQNLAARLQVAKNVAELNQALELEQRTNAANSKMASLGQMSAAIAHEINGPLAVIVGASERLKTLLAQEQLDREELIRKASKIEGTAQRVSRIIKGLRAFSGNGAAEPFASHPVGQVLDETLQFCRERFEHGGVELREPPILFDDLTIECRSVQLSQVLLNLINNAYLAAVETQGRWVSIEVRDLGDSLEFSVTDSGAGIPAAVRERIMQPFYTTRAPGSGSGLGLSISKQLVESHGGLLRVDADCPNTRFAFTLPKRQPARAGGPTAA